ncbi:MAG: putative hydrolase [Clostridiales bacterium]|jgi:putative hydrolase|nr:putative hydrolase [Clostridiales bacterium]
MKNLLDLHTHTTASGHAYSTLNENVISAKANGLEIIGVSDHAPNMPGGAPVFYFHNLKVIPDVIEGVRLLKGAEVNVLDDDGNMDLDDRAFDRLDYAIASLHIPCYDDRGAERNTEALIEVMKHPKIKIIGHPDDSRLPMSYEKLVKAAKANHVLLEVNNSSLRPNSARKNADENYKEMLALCKQYEVPIIIGSDAHFNIDVGRYDDAIAVIESVGFPKDRIANFNMDLFKEFFEV